jgi:hypothetical protein
MVIFLALWAFYRKLIIPSIAVSFGISILYTGIDGLLPAFGICYIILTPFFHFIIYDLTSEKEYYFYYTFGLSKLTLWLSTIGMSTIFGLILISI